MYAVFEDGSRQYRVSEGSQIEVDFREADKGAQVTFDRVLLYANGAAYPMVSAKVSVPLSGAGGTIPAANVVLYAEQYYNVHTASNDEGSSRRNGR